MKPRVYKKGFFDTGQGHSLYYELYGNARGTPVVFLHGGPGAGFSKKDYSFFDPAKFNVLFFDQRGAGKSKATNPLAANTTKHLVEDTKKLMQHVGFEKAIVFGGSWGSCLSMLFAIRHTNMVSGLVLRGIYLADRTAREHFYLGGIKNFYPAEFEQFISLVPKKHRNNPEKYYYQKILHGNKRERKKYLDEWVRIELSILHLAPDQKELGKEMTGEWHRRFALIECHFLSKNCFISYNYVKKNLHKLRHLPVSIVHGRYDMVCPPVSAYELHQKLPKSRLSFTTAGHAGHDEENEKKLVEEVNRMRK
ncbi:MAG: prolyl aminopeptidase [Candidatus Diapherotrites archaeon]|nr:prolyl aminopeptidase [Candidatus Diapherotrites archaeon]